MRAEPLSPERVVERVVEMVVERASDSAADGDWTTVAVDGAPGSGGPELAAEVAARLPEHGHAVLSISARDFLRPASLRYEYGREDPDVFYDEWLDTKGHSYQVVNLDEHPERQAEALSLSGALTVPITVVTKQDDSKEVVVGFNLSKLAPAVA